MVNLKEISRSQIVIPYGPGATFDYEYFSAITMVVDDWGLDQQKIEKLSINNDRFISYINNRLRNKYEKNKYKPIKNIIEAPIPYIDGATEDDSAIMSPYVVRKFPGWGQCVNCNAISKYDPMYDRSARCTNPNLPPWQKFKNKKTCKALGGSEILPVRFVGYCSSGHIQDFPWIKYMSNNCKEDCTMETDNRHTNHNPSLYVRDNGASEGFSSMFIQCGKCKSISGMTGLNKEEIRNQKINKYGERIFKCDGSKPWSKGENEDCDNIIKIVPRNASSLYNVVNEVALYIPDASQVSSHIIDDPEIQDIIMNDTLLDAEIPIALKTLDPEIFEKYDISKEDLSKLILEQRKEPEIYNDEEVENDFMFSEYETLKKISGNISEDFETNAISLDKYNIDFSQWFESLHQIKKVTTHTVLLGFYRGIETDEDQGQNVFNPSRRSAQYMPAFKYLGEGIFIDFGYSKIKNWLDKETNFQAQEKKLKEEIEKENFLAKGELGKAHQGYVLIHTFSHIIMRQLSLESGYGLSDIKERIYFSPDHNMAGLMIYTSGSDSGGSLGGLVRAIKPGYFENLFRNAIYNSRFCSRDPICYENNQEGLNKLNFAACHACCMTSDLACETRSKNSYLDRKTIIGDRNKEHGYFNSF